MCRVLHTLYWAHLHKQPCEADHCFSKELLLTQPTDLPIQEVQDRAWLSQTKIHSQCSLDPSAVHFLRWAFYFCRGSHGLEALPVCGNVHSCLPAFIPLSNICYLFYNNI